MMRRYIGRATGQHRRRKTHPYVWAGATALTAFGLLVMYVLVFNPGADHSPDERKGSASPSVTPSGSPKPTDSGLPRHHSRQ